MKILLMLFLLAVTINANANPPEEPDPQEKKAVIKLQPCPSWVFYSPSMGYACLNPGPTTSIYSMAEVNNRFASMQRQIDALEARVKELEAKQP